MTEKDNGKIMVQEKREIANLVSQQFNEVISELEQRETATAIEVTAKISKKLGKAMIDKEVEMHKKKIEALEDSIRKLGFSGSDLRKTYNKEGVYAIDETTPAGKLYYEIAKRQPEIRKLQGKRNEVLRKIWLSDTKVEVKKLTDNPIGKITFTSVKELIKV